MATKAGSNNLEPQSEWGRIRDLYHEMLYWFYEKGERDEALKVADAFETWLKKVSDEHEAVFGEECWSLLFELRGDLEKAIEHRENEIRLLERLLKITSDSERLRKSTGYDYSDLADRLELLAILYHDAGRLDQAIDSLKKSRRICRPHKL